MKKPNFSFNAEKLGFLILKLPLRCKSAFSSRYPILKKLFPYSGLGLILAIIIMIISEI